MNFTILTFFKLNGIKYIHIVVQPSPPSISKQCHHSTLNFDFILH
jgi:hypothetical protein